MIGAAELTLRGLRYDEFPIYDTDARIGYIPRPNQIGDFAGRYLWKLNERSMLNEPWVPDHGHGILVIGDSLVWGEVEMASEEKLGACLQRTLGDRYHVWSVGAGSWANLNEVEYLNRNEDVVRNIRGLIWIANAGDFGDRSRWDSDFVHPRRRPIFLLGYLVGKVVVPRVKRLFPEFDGKHDLNGDAGSNVSAEAKQELRAWLRSAPRDLLRRSLFVWFPDAAEFKSRDAATSRLLSEVRGLVEGEGLRFFDLRGDTRWQADCYRDPIHPSAYGNRVLAAILEAQLPAGDPSAASP